MTSRHASGLIIITRLLGGRDQLLIMIVIAVVIGQIMLVLAPVEDHRRLIGQGTRVRCAAAAALQEAGTIPETGLHVPGIQRAAGTGQGTDLRLAAAGVLGQLRAAAVVTGAVAGAQGKKAIVGLLAATRGGRGTAGLLIGLAR